MKKILTSTLSLLPVALFAHGGHGTFDPNSVIHYLGSVEHALPAAGLALAVACLLFFRRKKQ